MNLADFLRQGPLTQQRMADASAFDRDSELANMMKQHGTVQDPNMVQEPIVLGNLPIDVPQPTEQDMQLGGEQIMGMMPMAGITAFHGSPHKFTKFDMSKIGTGEGAQAYGHGLYAAENPKVAKGYRDALSDGGVVLNQSLDDTREEVIKRIAKEREYFDSPDYANAIPDPIVEKRRWMLTDAQNKSNNAKDGLNLHGYGGEKFKALEAQGVDLKDLYDVRDGYLYKVDIPDDQIAKMLDWDKPLSGQGEISKAIDNAMERMESKEELETFLRYSLKPQYNILFGNKSGSGGYGRLSAMLGGDVQASKALQEQGIPGIKYLDQGSRSGGQGTSNFVLFADDIAKILERNDQPIGELAEMLSSGKKVKP